MDPKRPETPHKETSFPRTGGDGPMYDTNAVMVLQFPPHRRGWTWHPGVSPTGPRVSPAQAGMDPRLPLRPGRPPSFPRTGGDGPLTPVIFADPAAFPPHRRGWT